MGLDANIYARPIGPDNFITDAQLARAELVMVHAPLFDPHSPSLGPALQRSGWTGDGRVTVNTLDRYYSPVYPRGNWTSIYVTIRLLQSALPGCTVFYGADCSDGGDECTEELLSSITDHFRASGLVDTEARADVAVFDASMAEGAPNILYRPEWEWPSATHGTPTISLRDFRASIPYGKAHPGLDEFHESTTHNPEAP